MPHWERLRAAIDQRGLSHLVGKSGEVAVQRLERELSGGGMPADFDPLMHATMRIYGQFTEDVGLAAFVGELCPLCEVKKQRDDLDENWIQGVSDEALAGARHLKLVPEPA